MALTAHQLGRLTVFGEEIAAGLDAVMAFGETTLLLGQASEPPVRISRALDLGCGAGALALLLSRCADSVTGVDLNPRAISLAARNARHNLIDNAEFRRGDGFQPVAQDRFDLIVSQPPFLPLPPDHTRDLTVHGGQRGDELALRWLRDSVSLLSPGGRAVFLFDRPADAPIHIPGLWLRGPVVPAGEYAGGYSPWLKGTPVPDMRPYLAVRRQADTEPLIWDVPAESWRAITRRRIDEIFASLELATASDDVFLNTRLEPAEGAALLSRTSVLDPGQPEQTVVFAPEALLAPVENATPLWEMLMNFRLPLAPRTSGEDPRRVRDALARGWLRPTSSSI